MTDYAELVKKLREHNGWALNETLNAAADAIEQLQTECQDWYKDYMDLLPTRWYSVEECLPSEDGFTLIFTAHGHAGVCYFTNGWWGGYGEDGITHWMPLPTPPKEETE